MIRGEGNNGVKRGKGQAKEHRGLMGTDNGGEIDCGSGGQGRGEQGDKRWDNCN